MSATEGTGVEESERESCGVGTIFDEEAIVGAGSCAYVIARLSSSFVRDGAVLR